MDTHEQLKEKFSALPPEKVLEIAITASLDLEKERTIRAAEKKLYKSVQQRASDALRRNEELETLYKAQFLTILGLLYTQQKIVEKYENLAKQHDEANAKILALQCVKDIYAKKIFGQSSEQLSRLLNPSRTKLANSDDENDGNDNNDKDKTSDNQESEKAKNSPKVPGDVGFLMAANRDAKSSAAEVKKIYSVSL